MPGATRILVKSAVSPERPDSQPKEGVPKHKLITIAAATTVVLVTVIICVTVSVVVTSECNDSVIE